VGEQVRAELVGTVLQVAVAPGDAVGAGALLVLLETMKMEVPAVPEAAGTVVRVAVAPGDLVQAGDLLVELS
jgi:acetyl-CoA carboxylase biotin carboxyl carrier protein